MGKVRDTQINENGNAMLNFNVIPDEFIRYSENDRIMSTLEALKKFVGKEPESVIIKTGTLDCSYCQFTGGGDIHICNINNRTTLPIAK